MQEIKRRNVPFTELSLDNNEENQKLYTKMGRGKLPYIIAGKYKVSGFYKAMIASALAQTYGDKYLTQLEKQYYSNHFYEDGSPMIYMYGAAWCPYCKKMRKEFSARRMDYVELDVENTSDQDLLVNTMQIEGYPVIYVGYRRIQGGANINQVLKAVEIAKDRQL